MNTDPPQPYSELTAPTAPQSPAQADELDIRALLTNSGISTVELQIKVHRLADGACLDHARFIVTVVNRRMHVSRTYWGAAGSDWVCAFLDDARTGLFGRVRETTQRLHFPVSQRRPPRRAQNTPHEQTTRSLGVSLAAGARW